jgi:hypothetical protein
MPSVATSSLTAGVSLARRALRAQGCVVAAGAFAAAANSTSLPAAHARTAALRLPAVRPSAVSTSLRSVAQLRTGARAVLQRAWCTPALSRASATRAMAGAHPRRRA